MPVRGNKALRSNRSREARLKAEKERAVPKYDFSVDGVSVEAVFNKLGGSEGAKRFLSNELVVSEPSPPEPSLHVDYAKLAQFVSPEGTVSLDDCKKCTVPRWHRAPDGTIRVQAVSNGWSGEKWIAWYDEHGYPLSDEAKFLLRSADFKPSKAGTIYEIAVLPGDLLPDNKRITKNIRAKADELKLKHGQDENPEIVCLIRQKFSNQEIRDMGLLWIVGLHETISGSGGYPSLLSADASDAEPWLNAYWGKPDDRWGRRNGFVCVVSPVSPLPSGS